ncbi:oxidoreductase-like domain-containing protein [Ramlibacter humi]|uniref:oxidoreductase-like domain-containing protein n=1 Tax=Ramlibacter humi TaxID=2530451 RepID=UPI003F6A6305
MQGVRAALSSRSLALRAPPPEPTTCCGRGCNGCVWEGYEEALARWLDDARAVLG